VDDLNAFVRMNGISNDNQSGHPMLRARLREYMYSTRFLQRTSARARLQGILSPDLQSEVIGMVDSCWLRNVPFLRTAEKTVGVRLAMSVAPAIFPPSELVPTGQIFVMISGVGLYAGKLIAKDKVFGFDSLLRSKYLPCHSARAMSFLEVYVIQPATLRNIIADFPKARYQTHRWIGFKALSNYLVANLYEAQREARAKVLEERAARRSFTRSTFDGTSSADMNGLHSTTNGKKGSAENLFAHLGGPGSNRAETDHTLEEQTDWAAKFDRTSHSVHSGGHDDFTLGSMTESLKATAESLKATATAAAANLDSARLKATQKVQEIKEAAAEAYTSNTPVIREASYSQAVSEHLANESAHYAAMGRPNYMARQESRNANSNSECGFGSGSSLFNLFAGTAGVIFGPTSPSRPKVTSSGSQKITKGLGPRRRSLGFKQRGISQSLSDSSDDITSMVIGIGSVLPLQGEGSQKFAAAPTMAPGPSAEIAQMREEMASLTALVSQSLAETKSLAQLVTSGAHLGASANGAGLYALDASRRVTSPPSQRSGRSASRTRRTLHSPERERPQRERAPAPSKPIEPSAVRQEWDKNGAPAGAVGGANGDANGTGEMGLIDLADTIADTLPMMTSKGVSFKEKKNGGPLSRTTSWPCGEGRRQHEGFESSRARAANGLAAKFVAEASRARGPNGLAPDFIGHARIESSSDDYEAQPPVSAPKPGSSGAPSVGSGHSKASRTRVSRKASVNSNGVRETVPEDDTAARSLAQSVARARSLAQSVASSADGNSKHSMFL